jgi:hypothetical protein
MSLLLNRILTASGVMPNCLAISEAGIPSIYKSISTEPGINQVEKTKSYSNITLKRYMYHFDTVNGQNDTLLGNLASRKKIKNFIQNLDNPIIRGYILL